MQNLPDQTLSDHNFLCHRQGELTTLKIVGAVGMAELLQFFGRYYAGSPTPYMAVDVSSAPVTPFSAADAESLNLQLANMPNMQGSERSAIIAPSNLHYGMSRMFATFAEAQGLARDIGIFRTHAEAEAWLGLPIPVLG